MKSCPDTRFCLIWLRYQWLPCLGQICLYFVFGTFNGTRRALATKLLRGRLHVRTRLRMMRCLPNEWSRYDPRLLRLWVKFRHPRSDGASRLTVCAARMRPQRTRRSRLPTESSSYACPGARVSHSGRRRSRVLHPCLLFCRQSRAKSNMPNRVGKE